ncbi:hypothetical protein HYW46_03075 [Candidatus Daviesbacteria bacterium]|nr:hypothetical protein [Candidatus Daviesbacteria bacterium]
MNKKELIEQYLKLGLWWVLYENDFREFPQNVHDQALAKLEETETKLKEIGITDIAIIALNDHVQRIKNSKIGDLKPSEQLFLCKVIFGNDCAEAKTDNIEKKMLQLEAVRVGPKEPTPGFGGMHWTEFADKLSDYHFNKVKKSEGL